MITEGDSEEGSYFKDMMLIILAYIGLYAIGYWSWQQWRRRQLQTATEDIHRSDSSGMWTDKLLQLMKLSMNFVHVHGGVLEFVI